MQELQDKMEQAVIERENLGKMFRRNKIDDDTYLEESDKVETTLSITGMKITEAKRLIDKSVSIKGYVA
jgi:hypothetical protein